MGPSPGQQGLVARVVGRLRHMRQSAEYLYRIASLHREVNDLRAQMEGTQVLRDDSADVRARIAETRARVDLALGVLNRIETQLDAVRSQREVADDIHDQLASYRASEAYERIFKAEWPLVSVGVATFDRAELLTTRCLPSILGQDYPNLEVIVVGDACTDGTAEAIGRLNDRRIRFTNLAERTPHPEDLESYWLTGGGPCGNHVRALANGEFITQLDDDDEFAPGRIRKLVQFAKERRAEVIWHPFWAESATGEWTLNDASEFRLGQVTTGSVMYLSWFRRFEWHPNAYRGREPADWYRFRKMKYVGARLARFDEPLLRHYKEQNQPYIRAARPNDETP